MSDAQALPLEIGGIAGRDLGDTILRSPRVKDESKFIRVTKSIRHGWAFDDGHSPVYMMEPRAVHTTPFSARAICE